MQGLDLNSPLPSRLPWEPFCSCRGCSFHRIHGQEGKPPPCQRSPFGFRQCKCCFPAHSRILVIGERTHIAAAVQVQSLVHFSPDFQRLEDVARRLLGNRFSQAIDHVPGKLLVILFVTRADLRAFLSESRDARTQNEKWEGKDKATLVHHGTPTPLKMRVQ